MTTGKHSRQCWIMSFVTRSFLQRFRARSATSELGQETQAARRFARASRRLWSCACGMALSISSSSRRKRSSLAAWEKGQKRSRARATLCASLGSLPTYFWMHSTSCAWKAPSVSSLCSGFSTLKSTCRCSSFRGTAKPLMTFAKTSRSSAVPFCTSPSYAAARQAFWMLRRMNVRCGAYRAWILMRIVFRHSRSRPSSESKSSSSFSRKRWSTALIEAPTSTSLASTKRRRNS
mmetsp:Transcript_70330/g.227712  ORF Transcript_70330/g.227712 Transcript_70330/m.227712 type:complete len:234 (+) Transcript_70330:301-1002(+)